VFFNSKNKEVISINNFNLMILGVTCWLKFKYTDYLNKIESSINYYEVNNFGAL